MTHELAFDVTIKRKNSYQCLRDSRQPLNVQLVLTQVEYLQGPVPLQNLRDVCDSSLMMGVNILQQSPRLDMVY